MQGRTAGICFFHDDKCEEITPGFSNKGDGLPKCLNMAHIMDMYPKLDKKPWKSAKFWHGNPHEFGVNPCDMMDVIE